MAVEYIKGVWGGFGATGTLPQGLKDNMGIVGIAVTRNWSQIQPNRDVLGVPQFFWGDLEGDIAEAKAGGFNHINVGITNSTNDLPDWLRSDLAAAGQTIALRDPGQNHSTYCQPIDTPLYWSPVFQARRLALVAAAGAHFSGDPAIHGVMGSFCNHNSMDWNVQDTQGELSGMHCTNGPFTVDQPSQWNEAGWTRALMRTVGQQMLDAVALAWPNQVIKLPIGGLNDELARFTRAAVVTSGSKIVTSATAAFTTADLHKRIIGYTSPPGSAGTPCIPVNTFIGTVVNATTIWLSSSSGSQVDVNATSNGDRVSLPERDPHLQIAGTTPEYATLAVEIKAYIDMQSYASRVFIQRNTVDANWGTRQDLIDTPPGLGSERYIKKMVSIAVPQSGLQNVSKATGTATDKPPYRQNGNMACDVSETTEECELEVMTNSCAIAKDFAKPDDGILFYEIWPQDSQNPNFYDLIRDTTIYMGGMPRNADTGIPVILGPFTIDAIVGVSVNEQIRATNNPTQYTAFLLPPVMGYNLDTGRIFGKPSEQALGVTLLTLTAENANGIGTAQCILTVTEGLGGGGNTGVSTYRGKVWLDPLERIDYADLDDAGHVVCQFDTGSVGAAQMTDDAVSKKLGYVGGAGKIGQYVFAKDFVLGPQIKLSTRVAQIAMPGIVAGDIVVVDELILGSGLLPNPILNLLYFGLAKANSVELYAFTVGGTGGQTLPANSRINFRVFSS